MSHPPLNLPAGSKVAPHFWWWLLPPLFMGLLSINGYSFWIDECMTARFVSQPTLAAWWHDIRTTNYPEAQMPLYVFYLWVWEKLFGSGELSLRVAGLPWFVPGVAVFLYSLRRLGSRRAAVIIVTCCSPFLWYYLNEARPYAMQVGVSCLIFAALAECQSSKEEASSRWFPVFLFGLLLLSAISIIGMVWISAAIIAAWGMFPAATLKDWGRRHRRLTFVVAGLLCVLGAYYFWTVQRGAKATMIGTTNVQSMAFILYEQLGFTGLGPGRTELRVQGARALTAYLPWLCLYTIAVGMVLAAGVRVVWKSSARKQALWIVAGLNLPVAFFLVSGMLAHFRVLGRHLTPLMPVWLCLLSLGVISLWRRGPAGRTVGLVFLCLSLASAFQVRMAYRHMKDDYRSAVSFAKTALQSGRSVWWNASSEAANHYNLPLTSNPRQREKALLVFNPRTGTLTDLPWPDVVVITKPDIYDPLRVVMSCLKQADYRQETNFPAFEIWGRSQ
jgi:hypothetical protein